ncbi:MAG: efflux RND transporter periplasmic adaptor subunit [Mucilaginibacter polytrichastri]|nr:efflux RND transporter periplasmic adaptor subunit [Mucilaginibacter polytrichastri]
MKRMLMLMSLCGILCHMSCTNQEKEKEEESKLLVTSPFKTDTATVNDYVCQIKSIRHIDLRAQERGYLQKIYIDEGQFVKAGTLLFRITPKLYQAEMDKAQAEVNYAGVEYNTTKKLTDSNIVSPNELAMAKAKLAKAKAELALNKVHIQFTEIRAPFDGYIDRLQVRLGSLIDEGELLTTLSDNSKMWVYFNVPEAEYLNYNNKQGGNAKKVSLLMANNQVFKYPGVVETVEADFDNETGNIPFRATFPNPDGLLRHGETGSIKMEVPLKNALIIPQKATYEVLDKKYVYLVGADHHIHSKEISVGAELDDIYMVTAGLKESDKVLLEGLSKVKDGQKISYDFEEPKKVISELRLPAE